MTQIDLNDASEKLRWAERHFEVLASQIEAFEKRDAHRISVEINPDSGEYTFSVHDLEAVDPDWGLIIGDCIHNARTALDYLAVRLWALVKGIAPDEVGKISFPIYGARIPDNATQAEIDQAFADARDEYKRATAKLGKEPGFSGYLTTIQQLQPFNNANPSIWGTTEHRMPRHAALPNALDRLSLLDNIDKHRVPHATWVALDIFGGIDVGKIAPPTFKSLAGSRTGNALVDDAEIATWRFVTPLPHEWIPSQVDMQRCFPLQVAFSDPGLFHGVLEVLKLCLWGVDAVLTIFGPVFGPHRKPPLPVTAIPDPAL